MRSRDKRQVMTMSRVVLPNCNATMCWRSCNKLKAMLNGIFWKGGHQYWRVARKGLPIEGALTSPLIFTNTMNSVSGNVHTIHYFGEVQHRHWQLNSREAINQGQWLSPEAKSIFAKTTSLNTSGNKLGVTLGRQGLWEPSRKRPGYVASLV